MSSQEELLSKDWWAEGDTPVHRDSRVTYFVDGRIVMLSMCLHYLRARSYIYLANWGMTPTIELVRGSDHVAGPDGSAEQERLMAELRANGLSESDIDFWRTHDLSLQAVLGYAVSKGVEVKVLLWASSKFFSHYDPQAAFKELTEVGVTCLLDESAHGVLHHPVESLHQKISIVDGTHAFVGGVDPLAEKEGEFDRWDTPAHAYSSPLRRTQKGSSPHPWHDAHTLIEGAAAGDVELNFRERWNDVVKRQGYGQRLHIAEHEPAPALESSSLVQVTRTIPKHTYTFDPKPGIQGIAQLYAKALSNVQHFIYLENQYFWLRAYTGLDFSLFGFDSPDMESNIRKLGGALQRGASMAIVLPDHPNAGRAFTDAGLTRLQEEAPQAEAEGRIHAFCLGTSARLDDGEHYRPIYVHAKVAIIDDVWTTVGSGNLNNRGMRDDTEMNVATLDRRLAEGLRMMLWAEHLGLLDDGDLFDLERYLGRQPQLPQEHARGEHIWHYCRKVLGNPQEGLRLMLERAQDNLRRYKARLPLVGHLLPYLKAEEATQQGLNFREEHGWIEEE